ncbi:MAG TPA: WhiB family transcriptional regulator [Micromonosporaceae bacterium]|jgi:WhiB family redox-sensing transcriptional regulator
MSNVRRLPGPLADVWDWQMDGLCRGRDSAQFFHPDGERGSARSRRESAAKALCRACPVRPECAAAALASREPYGVWGGFTETERLRLLSIGWQDASQRYRRRVDVGQLEAKLRVDSAAGYVPIHPRNRILADIHTDLVITG